MEGARCKQDETHKVFAHFTACILTALAGKRRRIRGEDILRLKAHGQAASRAELEKMFADTVEMMGPLAKPVRGGGSNGRGNRPGGR